MTKCRVCGEDFTPQLKHPGYVNVCLDEECRALAHELRDITLHTDLSEVSLQMQHDHEKQAGRNDGDILDWMSDALLC